MTTFIFICMVWRRLSREWICAFYVLMAGATWKSQSYIQEAMVGFGLAFKKYRWSRFLENYPYIKLPYTSLKKYTNDIHIYKWIRCILGINMAWCFNYTVQQHYTIIHHIYHGGKKWCHFKMSCMGPVFPVHTKLYSYLQWFLNPFWTQCGPYVYL